MAAILTIIVATLALAWLTRALIVRWRAKSGRPAGAAPIRTLVVMGSGGHTAEMLALLGGLDRRKYAPLLYAFAASDHTSPRRVAAFEEERAEADGLPQPPGYQMLRIPRSREVGQSYWTSVPTTLHATFRSLLLVLRERPSLVLCNGPGTCIPIVMSAWALRLSGWQHVEICFVESFCRVDSLSLSGRLLMMASAVGLCEHFLVQWPQLAAKYPRATYIGRLC